MPTVREMLHQLEAVDITTLRRHCYYGVSLEERKILQKKGYALYQGKVREVVQKGDHLFMYHTDRLSAFDRYIGMVPYKGTILTALTAFWLREAQKIVPTHYIGMPHERVLEVKKAQPVKAEVIVRGYLAGSMLRAYEKGERRFCGQTLPEGLQPFQKLPAPLLTPTTKAAVYQHDEDTTPEALFQSGVVSEREWRTISEMALAIFEQGTSLYADKGWILVDTKYEFGRDQDDAIILIDEAHTPDSSRLWVAEGYAERLKRSVSPEMLDKEIIRRHLAEKGFTGEGDVPDVPPSLLLNLANVYLTVAERLREQPLMTQGPLRASPCLDQFGQDGYLGDICGQETSEHRERC